jgi:hypothetical protein
VIPANAGVGEEEVGLGTRGEVIERERGAEEWGPTWPY